MTNKKFLILIIFGIGIISVLIVVGFVLYSKYLRVIPQLPPQSPFITSEGIIDPEKFLTHFENCLTGKENPPLNPKTHWPDAIYATIEALSERSEQSCLNLEKAQKEECLKYLYISEMFTKKNVDYCEQLRPLIPAGPYLYCLMVAKNDVSYCQQIENSLDREICLAIPESDRCDYLSGDLKTGDVKTYELESFGIEGSKIEKEQQIQFEEDARKTCKKVVYLIRAIKEKNSVLCDSPEFKDDNFSKLFCQNLSSPEPKRNWQELRQKICYEKLAPTAALLKKDPSICEQIPFKEGFNQGLYNFCLEPFK